MSWDTDRLSIGTLTTIVNVEQLFAAVAPTTPGELVVCQVEGIGFSSTDLLIVAIYSAIDNSPSTTQFDTDPLFEFVMTNLNATGRKTFEVRNLYRFRVGVRMNGATDTLTSAELFVRTDNVDL